MTCSAVTGGPSKAECKAVNSSVVQHNIGHFGARLSFLGRDFIFTRALQPVTRLILTARNPNWVMIYLMQSLHQAWRNVCEAAEGLRLIEYGGDANISPTCKLARAG